MDANKTDSVAVLREKHIADLQFLRNDCGPDEPYAAALDAAIAALSAQGAEPVAWIRFCSDGGYEGPIHDSRMEDVRKQSGAWTPLYLNPAPPGADAVTDDQCDAVYDALDAWAREVDSYDFGLPMAAGGGKESARQIIRAALASRTGKGEANGR